MEDETNTSRFQSFAQQMLGMFGEPTDEEIKKEREEQERLEQEEYNKKMKNLFVQAGIPKRFIEAKADDFKDTKFKIFGYENKVGIKEILKIVADGYSLVIVGNSGAGKNHLVNMIIKRAIIKHRKKCRIIRANTFRALVSDMFSGKNPFVNYQEDMLVLDDVDYAIKQDKTSDGVIREVIEGFIRDRYDSMKQTFIIANRNSVDFLSVPVLSRMKQQYVTISILPPESEEDDKRLMLKPKIEEILNGDANP